MDQNQVIYWALLLKTITMEADIFLLLLNRSWWNSWLEKIKGYKKSKKKEEKDSRKKGKEQKKKE